MFLLSNLKIRSCTGEKEDIFGEGYIEFPDSLYKESLNNKTGLGKDNCIAVQYEFEIQAYEEKNWTEEYSNSYGDFSSDGKEYSMIVT